MGVFSLQCCGWCCGVFSIFGCIMLLIISFALDSNTRVLPYARDDPDKRKKAAENALIAAIIYAVFIVISGGCILANRYKTRRAGSQAEDRLLHESLLHGHAPPSHL